MRVKLFQHVSVRMGGPEEERIIDEALFRCQPELVVQGFESGGLRHDVRHVHVRRHASGRRRPAFGGDVGLVGQSRFAEMHMVVYHARYQVQPFGIYHAVGRRKGVYGIVGRDDTQNLVVFQCDRTYEAFSFVDDGGILYSGSHNGFLYRVFFSSCFYNILFSEKMIGVFGYFFFAFPVSRFSSDLSLRSTFSHLHWVEVVQEQYLVAGACLVRRHCCLRVLSRFLVVRTSPFVVR